VIFDEDTIKFKNEFNLNIFVNFIVVTKKIRRRLSYFLKIIVVTEKFTKMLYGENILKEIVI